MRKNIILKTILSFLLAFSLIVSLLGCKKEKSEAFHTSELHGKIAIINIWGTWCPPCRNELPEFDRIANDFKDEVTVIAVHSSDFTTIKPEDYVKENFQNSEIVFLWDKESSDSQFDAYYAAVGGAGYYPFTVILDKHGRITANITGATTYDRLAQEIEVAKLSGNIEFDMNSANVGCNIGDLCPTMELEYLIKE